MLTTFQCPVCTADDWTAVGSYAYYAHEHQPGGKWYDNAYVKLRRRVLFEIWFPGCTQVELKSQYCRQCGFMCYTPRPDTNDIDAKYAFLKEKEVNVGGQHDISDLAVRMDRKRAMRLYQNIRKVIPVKETLVLDVGGGDGKLLFPFQQDDCDCYIVDYNSLRKPGITRLGSTLKDIPAEMRFNIVICSHVVEHVADPVGFLRELGRFLRSDGIAYIEVPLEIWEDIPISVEPVTHVNFLTETSFANLLTAAHLNARRMRSTVGSYGRTRMQIVWAVTDRASGPMKSPLTRAEDTIKLIKPSPFTILKKTLFVDTQVTRSYFPIVELFLSLVKRITRLCA